MFLVELTLRYPPCHFGPAVPFSPDVARFVFRARKKGSGDSCLVPYFRIFKSTVLILGQLGQDALGEDSRCLLESCFAGQLLGQIHHHRALPI